MKIATYNVRVDTDYDRQWQWDYRKDYVLGLLTYHAWDLVGVQEVRPNQVEDLTSLKDYQVLAAERDGDGTGEGLAILYRPAFQLLDSGFFWLSETPDKPSIHPEAGYPRICLWGLFQEAGAAPFLVLNVHLDHVSEAARISGMKVLLTELADKIVDYPTILLGDFNAWPTDEVHHLVQAQFENGKTTSPSPHYGPDGTFQNFDYETSWQDLEEIDYIYLKGFAALKTGVLTDACDRRFPSDHFPLAMTIQTKD